MRRHAVFLTLISVASLLAGCASDEAPEEQIQSKEEVVLTQNLGAIVGVVVDDRFRPLQVQEKAGAGEYQFEGFLLLQETGERLQSNENGEFFAVDLEPGTYTIRVQIEGHEAAPQRVLVAAGEFAEVQILARRISSDGGFIVTDEFSVFSSCAISAIIFTASPDCTGDGSGDSDRFAFYPDYVPYNEANLTNLVAEMKMSNKAGGMRGTFTLLIRDGTNSSDYYGVRGVDEGQDYARIHMVRFGVSEQGISNAEWENNGPLEVALVGRGLLTSELNTVSPGSWGVGVQIAVKATFLVSLFLGPPEVDLVSYCVLCE